MIRMHRMAETLDRYIILVIDSILVILSTERVLVAVSAAL